MTINMLIVLFKGVSKFVRGKIEIILSVLVLYNMWDCGVRFCNKLRSL